jgi:hypothetical protein
LRKCGLASSRHGVTTISLSTAVTPGAVSAACRAVCKAASEGTWPSLDVGGGRLILRLELDQVIDDAHPREPADCALGGVSLRCRLDLSMQDDTPVTDFRRDRVGDLCSRAS